MNTLDIDVPAQPWYRQLWPWVLIALPGIVVVACLITIVIAIRTADDIVADNYYKQGLAINHDLSADNHARARELHARLDFTANASVVNVAIAGNAELPAQLTLRFLHPIQAASDLTLPLLGDGKQYTARLPSPLTGRWTVEITDHTAHWRLRREIALTAAQRSFVLTP